MAILRRLDTRNRLTARLVCCAFAKLGPDDALEVYPRKNADKQYLGIVYFCSAQARIGANGPKLAFKDSMPSAVTGSEPHRFFRPGLYAALGCANLSSLSLSISLSLQEAEMLLRFASALRKLWLHVPLEIVGSSVWSHLQTLTKVNLKLLQPSVATTEVRMAGGLGTVSGLKTLSFNFEEGLIESSKAARVDCTDLVLPQLSILVYNLSPFRDPLNADFCPNLQELRLTGSLVRLPGWVLGRPIAALGCVRWRKLLRVQDISDIKCSTLHVVLTSEAQELPMAALLALPNAQELLVSKHLYLSRRDPGGWPPLQLTGSPNEYRLLKNKLQLRFVNKSEVVVQLSSSHAVTSISENWHPVLCQCSGCF